MRSGNSWKLFQQQSKASLLKQSYFTADTTTHSSNKTQTLNSFFVFFKECVVEFWVALPCFQDFETPRCSRKQVTLAKSYKKLAKKKCIASMVIITWCILTTLYCNRSRKIGAKKSFWGPEVCMEQSGWVGFQPLSVLSFCYTPLSSNKHRPNGIFQAQLTSPSSKS